jgi:hypothetical protein
MTAGCTWEGWTKDDIDVLGPPVIRVFPPVIITFITQLIKVSASVDRQQNVVLPSKLLRHHDLSRAVD